MTDPITDAEIAEVEREWRDDAEVLGEKHSPGAITALKIIARLRRAEAERDSLKRLAEFADHSHICNINERRRGFDRGQCSCGYQVALDAARSACEGRQ